MGLRETAAKLAEKGIESIPGNVSVEITYQVYNIKTVNPEDPLSVVPYYQSFTFKVVVDTPKEDTEGLARNNNQQNSSDLNKEQYWGPMRVLLAAKSWNETVKTVPPRRGDRFIYEGEIYRVDAVRFDDPAQATYQITGSRVSSGEADEGVTEGLVVSVNYELPDENGNVLLGIGTPMPGGTAGSVPFVDSFLNWSEDNLGLNFDAATGRLGVNQNPAGAMVGVQAKTPADIGIQVQGAPDQTADRAQFLDDSGGTPVVVDADGNVGIGTATPDHALVVQDGAGGEKIYFNVNNNPSVTVDDTGAGTMLNTFGTLSDRGLIGTLTNHPIAFMVNTAESLRIATDRKVGINETSPGAMLHVNSREVTDIGIKVQGAAGQTANTFVVEQDATNIFAVNSFGGWEVRRPGGGYFTMTVVRPYIIGDSADLVWQGQSFVSESRGFAFLPRNDSGVNSDALCINDDGYISIGHRNAGTAMVDIRPYDITDVGLLVRGAAGQTAYVANISKGSSGATAHSNANNLVVEDDATTGISILTTDVTRAHIHFGSPADVTGGQVIWNVPNQTFEITTGGAIVFATGNKAEKARFDISGKFGINSSTPSAMFDIRAATAASRVMWLQAEGGQTNDLFVVADSFQGHLVTIGPNGNVGINESSPGAMLDINCAALTDIGIKVRGAAGQIANRAEFTDNGGGTPVVVDAAGNIAVDADQMVMLNGAGENTGVRFNSTSGDVEIVKGGAVVASW